MTNSLRFELVRVDELCWMLEMGRGSGMQGYTAHCEERPAVHSQGPEVWISPTSSPLTAE